MAVFDCRRTAQDMKAFIRGAGYSVGSGGNRPPIKRGVKPCGVRFLTPLFIALTLLALVGCASRGAAANQEGEQVKRSPDHQVPPVELSDVSQPGSPVGLPETPEESLIRLSKMWDEAFALRDEVLLRQVFHPSFTGIEAEIANMNSPKNKGTATPVGEITIESEAPDRVVLTAVFSYDEGAVRQRILLLGNASDRKIAGVQDLD